MRSGMMLVIVPLLLGPLAGCTTPKEPPPETHKVEGKIVYQDGKAFTAGGFIEFRHEADTGVSTVGDIEPTGSFVLHSNSAQHRVRGALEGSYLVTINPAAQDQQAQPIHLKKKYIVKAGDNFLTIEIEN